jgi:hypothetical protein
MWHCAAKSKAVPVFKIKAIKIYGWVALLSVEREMSGGQTGKLGGRSYSTEPTNISGLTEQNVMRP